MKKLITFVLVLGSAVALSANAASFIKVADDNNGQAQAMQGQQSTQDLSQIQDQSANNDPSNQADNSDYDNNDDSNNNAASTGDDDTN